MGIDKVASVLGSVRTLGQLLLPPRVWIAQESQGRALFLKKLANERPPKAYVPSPDLHRVLWGIHFRGPVLNAAGMFKNGECYSFVAHEGAAGYLGGTGTYNARLGNSKEDVVHPFVAYPHSGAASNWLGLPNDGDEANAPIASRISRLHGCPVGWSVMGSPDYKGQEKLEKLVAGMRLYADAGVDFLELNESCPNTEHGRPQDSDLAGRLNYVKEHFLNRRTRRLPVVVKFSNDTSVEHVKPLMDLLFSAGFDGVNFGNTSTNYSKRRASITPDEQKLYDTFTTDPSFGVGGGVSGRPLKEDSLLLCATAVQHLRAGKPSQEFHVIRTGGIESAHDIIASDSEGISLNQWFTGRWDAFMRDGYTSYKKLHEEYLRSRPR